jgi:hypothetical protein
MKKIVWTFGLIAGAILSAMMVLTVPFAEQIGFDKGEIIGYATMVAASLLIYFGVRSYRDTIGGGAVGFGRALAVGVLIAAVASACYVATWEAIFFGLRPDFLAKLQTHQIEKLKASGAPPAEVDKRLAEMKQFAELYQNPIVNVALTFLEPLPVELIVALVSAGVLSRRRQRGVEGSLSARRE